MAWKKGYRVPTNVIVGFLGSGKTTAITKLIEQRPGGEKWSILVNEFGVVSIDHALVESNREGVAVEELGGGCACCTMSLVFKPLLARFLRRTVPDRLILEPSGLSHPAKVIDILRSPTFANVIDLRNVICLIDPQDFDDVRWRETEVFQDQVQLADIVALNWTDDRDRDMIDRCRAWVEDFRPPKQRIVETSFGAIDPVLLDEQFQITRFPMFANAHPVESTDQELHELDLVSIGSTNAQQGSGESAETGLHNKSENEKESENHSEANLQQPTPGRPLRFQNKDASYDACGWIFHVDDIFDRDELLDLLGYVHPIVRLKGVFRCQHDWWMINRAKDGTSYATSAYRRDSRLEIILNQKTPGWNEFEQKLLDCLLPKDG